ncbi:MAG: polymer-forming cytoskeletal protein [Bacteroidetes bacterium]|nr:polymer-forming cytoskeletal protein [Bacteroidota bacterium]
MMNKRVDKPNERSIELNVMGNGVRIKGDVSCDKDFRLDGFIEGNLKVDAKLVIGRTGKVKGTVYAISADISGEIHGNIENKETLTLRESAVINGDIKTNKINIEIGAEFNGTCTMRDNKSDKPSINPAPETPYKQNNPLSQP